MRPIAEPHRPGWTHETRDGHNYFVRAPREASPGRSARAQWAASWQDETGKVGDFIRADTLTDVLSIFPARIRKLFLNCEEKS